MAIVKVTAAEFKKFAARARPDYRDYLTANLSKVLEDYGINRNSLRLCHFMAQIGHGCGLFTLRRENLNYKTTKQLLKIFGVGNHSAKITAAEAKSLIGEPKKLAERVYGLENSKKAKELGNTKPGDGYKFRGAGFLQITGRDSYTRHGAAIGVDLTDDADLAADAKNSLFLACEEWREKKCNKLADSDNLRALTKAVNGGINGLKERRALYSAAKKIWGDKLPE